MSKSGRPVVHTTATRRMPLMAVGLLSLASGVWLGLVRVGWNLPLPWPDTLIGHGPFMVCGLLGTLISLERAVALGRPWGYAAPVLVAAGALALDLPLGPVGPLLITAGSVVLIIILGVLWGRQPTLFLATMTLGAIAWTIGNAWWLNGAAIFRVVDWWVAFLVLTIAGERLELNRLLGQTAVVRAVFVSAITLVGAAVTLSERWPELGTRILGIGLLVVAAWLLRYDIVRRTIRQPGVTRYMAATLLIGYAWLGVGAGIAVISAAATPGVVYDAMLHALFLGFVMSMVFAHAPVIFPAVLGRPLVYSPRFYAHVGVLHLSLIVRILGDLVDDLGRWRAWGGLLNAVALGLFVANVGRSLVLARRVPETAHHASGDDVGSIIAPAQRRG